MDQFFAKVERTKCFQTSKLRWRCSSGVELNSRRSDRKVSLEVGSTRVQGGKKEHGYRRAQPWPTQVWSQCETEEMLFAGRVPDKQIYIYVHVVWLVYSVELRDFYLSFLIIQEGNCFKVIQKIHHSISHRTSKERFCHKEKAVQS